MQQINSKGITPLDRELPLLNAPFHGLDQHLIDSHELALEFPHATDGRGFSAAVRLRNDFAYKGRIWAWGHVLPDQWHNLVETGFDGVILHDDHFQRHGRDAWLSAIHSQPVYYPVAQTRFASQWWSNGLFSYPLGA